MKITTGNIHAQEVAIQKITTLLDSLFDNSFILAAFLKAGLKEEKTNIVTSLLHIVKDYEFIDKRLKNELCEYISGGGTPLEKKIVEAYIYDTYNHHKAKFVDIYMDSEIKIKQIGTKQ
jgi:hypothetical protein